MFFYSKKVYSDHPPIVNLNLIFEVVKTNRGSQNFKKQTKQAKNISKQAKNVSKQAKNIAKQDKNVRKSLKIVIWGFSSGFHNFKRIDDFVELFWAVPYELRVIFIILERHLSSKIQHE